MMTEMWKQYEQKPGVNGQTSLHVMQGVDSSGCEVMNCM